MSKRLEIDAALAKRLVEEQMPQWAELPVRPVAKSGHDNRTFHLGDDMLVRLPSTRHHAPQVEKEQRWLPELAGRVSVRIPTPIAVGRPGVGFARPWSVHRHIRHPYKGS